MGVAEAAVPKTVFVCLYVLVCLFGQRNIPNVTVFGQPIGERGELSDKLVSGELYRRSVPVMLTALHCDAVASVHSYRKKSAVKGAMTRSTIEVAHFRRNVSG